jgi:phage shock protein A
MRHPEDDEFLKRSMSWVNARADILRMQELAVFALQCADAGRIDLARRFAAELDTVTESATRHQHEYGPTGERGALMYEAMEKLHEHLHEARACWGAL